MLISPKHTGFVGLETPPSVHAVNGTDVDAISPVSPAGSSTTRTDSVSISDAGRALAARDAGSHLADTSTLDPERADQIRERVLSGAYDTLEVVSAVARRLLDSGDL